MSLFKTGDANHDQYASYSTEQLIQIVTDSTGNYQAGNVETARRILLARGLDYRTKEQIAAEKKLKAINAARGSATTNTSTTRPAFPQPQVRINRRNRTSSGTGLKGWHWVWIIFIVIRMIGCLMKHS